MTAHSVAELREAWRAIEGGEFAHGPRSAPTARSAATVWTPAASERVVAVVGCAGGVGASTVALALATAAGVLQSTSSKIRAPLACASVWCASIIRRMKCGSPVRSQ